ncbi:MAG: site-specific integrase [Rikenellaceae bacterium]
MGVTLQNFASNIIAQLFELSKHRTAENYRTTINSFMRFQRGAGVLLDDMFPELMLRYEAYLKGENLSMNSISFYMRILRAIYNRAVDKGIVEQRYPFKHVYTGVERTVKRALPLDVIRKIKEIDLSLNSDLSFARDIFLFSFYTRGMSFVDIAYLRKSNIKNGIITYRRRKTGQQLHIKWEECMAAIVSKYSDADSEYLLPILYKSRKDGTYQYKNVQSLINNKLKVIAGELDLSEPLTMYVARHSWASVARSCNVPIAVISEAMGHDSETTTQIYLASLDSAVVDRANTMILELL